MNIQEMHQVFRTLGQQLGIQLNRGILPESIDVYINQVITEKTQEELLMGVRTALQDSVTTQAQSMSPINAFRTLYRNVRYKINTTQVNENTGKVAFYNPDNGYHIINIPTVKSKVTLDIREHKISPMLFTGFSVEFNNTLRGNPVACRIIGSDVVETTLRDYCNGAGKDSPIVCLSSVPIIKDGQELLDGTSNEQLEVYINSKDTDIKYLNIHYIKTPNVVKYDVDINKCVNCDLPDYTHSNIIERAVQKYYQSIGATTDTNRRRQQD